MGSSGQRELMLCIFLGRKDVVGGFHIFVIFVIIFSCFQSSKSYAKEKKTLLHPKLCSKRRKKIIRLTSVNKVVSRTSHSQ